MSVQSDSEQWHPERNLMTQRGWRERVGAIVAIVAILGGVMFGFVRTVTSSTKSLTPYTTYFRTADEGIVCVLAKFPKTPRSSKVACSAERASRLRGNKPPCAVRGVVALRGDGKVEFGCHGATSEEFVSTVLTPDTPLVSRPFSCVESIAVVTCTIESGQGFSIKPGEMEELVAS